MSWVSLRRISESGGREGAKTSAFPERQVAATSLAQSELASLYGAHATSVALVCRRLLGDPSAAEDATHEVFLRVQRHLSRLPAAEEMRPWIYRIATNYCLNELRNRARREQNDLDELNPKDDGFHDTFVAKDYAESVLNSLPQRVRSIAWLAFVDGLRQDEIARELGLSRRTVTSRMRELRARVNALTPGAQQLSAHTLLRRSTKK
jgi:RNA polymerase sigma-70 factor (ECF subfamily)